MLIAFGSLQFGANEFAAFLLLHCIVVLFDLQLSSIENRDQAHQMQWAV